MNRLSSPRIIRLVLTSAAILVAMSLAPSRAGAQTIWDKIKQAAAQKKQQQQQQKAQGQQAATPANPAPADNAPAQSGDFGTPEGTATIASSLAYLDIVGIKLGMPMQDAMAALKAENKNFKQTVLTKSCVSLTSDCSKTATPHQTVGISAVAGNESVFLSLTPTAPQVVFSVKRQLKMQPTSVDALVASLQKKYGPESLSSATPGNPLGSSAGIVNYVWLFDLQGHLATGDQAVPFVDCADIANVVANSAGSLGADNAAVSFDMQSHNSIAANSGNDPYPYPGTNHCVAVTTVTALMKVDKNGMASTLAVEIASFPLLHSALRMAWTEFDQQVKDQAAQQQKTQQGATVASAPPARPPIPMTGAAQQPSGQGSGAANGRAPIPLPGASAQVAGQSSGRAPIPVSQPAAQGASSAGDNSGVVVAIDASKLPDVVGIHLGVGVEDAKAILKEHYPTLPIAASGVNSIAVKGGATGDSVAIDITEAPDAPLVWHVGRVAVHQHIARDTLIAALRQKYGKETFNGHAALAAQPVSDAQIQMMEWVFDEQGNPVTGAKLVNGAVDGCAMGGSASAASAAAARTFYESGLTAGALAVKGECTSLVLLGVQFVETADIIETFHTSAVDLGLVSREAKVTYASKQTPTEAKHQQDLEKAKQTKPSL